MDPDVVRLGRGSHELFRFRQVVIMGRRCTIGYGIARRNLGLNVALRTA